jgi:ribonuclease HI
VKINIQWNEFKQMSKLHIQSKLNFGKYKGHSIEYILNHDAQYIEWCIKNNVIRLRDSALKIINRSIHGYVNDITLYTDASYFSNGRCGYAFYAKWGQYHINSYGELKGAIGSSQAELKCIGNALYFLTHHVKGLPMGVSLHIYSDSEYALRKIKSSVKNTNHPKLIKLTAKILNDFKTKYNVSKVYLKHVKAHSGVELNEWCDKHSRLFLKNESNTEITKKGIQTS